MTASKVWNKMNGLQSIQEIVVNDNPQYVAVTTETFCPDSHVNWWQRLALSIGHVNTSLGLQGICKGSGKGANISGVGPHVRHQ